MKKKIYLQPAIEVAGIMPIQLMAGTEGWAKDCNPPTAVVKEEDVNENDKISSGLWDDEGFLDLD